MSVEGDGHARVLADQLQADPAAIDERTSWSGGHEITIAGLDIISRYIDALLKAERATVAEATARLIDEIEDAIDHPDDD